MQFPTHTGLGWDTLHPRALLRLPDRMLRWLVAILLTAERTGEWPQAVQMTIFFFLPSILLSGFMFPFRGMPQWAQWLGEVLPLTHFLRIVRGILLKGNGISEIAPDLLALLAFLTVVSIVSLNRFRQTLD